VRFSTINKGNSENPHKNSKENWGKSMPKTFCQKSWEKYIFLPVVFFPLICFNRVFGRFSA
jgi:hypothetical protein